MKVFDIQRGFQVLLVFAVLSLVLLCFHLYDTFVTSLAPSPGCVIPYYDPFDPLAVQYSEQLSPYGCVYEPWLTSVEQGTLAVDQDMLHQRAEQVVNCSYQSIQRAENSDNEVVFDAPVSFMSSAQPQVDFVSVKCFLRSTTAGKAKEQQYKAYHYVMREKPELEDLLQSRQQKRKPKSPHTVLPTPQKKEWLNVLMVGVDSVSRFNMMRLMPRLRTFLSDQLHAIELTNFNKVGDNTFPNILALLTGSHLGNDITDELYTLGVMDKDRMDRQGLQMLWEDFAQAGYRTLYNEDYTDLGTFNWGKGSGFHDPPTHYYFRPMERAKEKHSGLFSRGHHCFKGVPNDELMLNYTMDYCRLFRHKPHFAFSFIVKTTHGHINGGSQVDEYHEQFLMRMKSQGLLDNTVLVYFSDHGARGLRRSTGFKNTPMGKFEEMRPFLYLVFPPWFGEAYPHLLKRVQTNAARLTTPFEVHATLLDVLYLRHQDPNTRKHLNGISLFDEISSSRTCAEAGIPLPYCVCLVDSPLSPKSSLATEGGEAVISSLNKAQESVTDKCHVLTLGEVTAFAQVEAGGKYLDLICEGWLPDKSLYRITLTAQPSGAEFEALLSKCSRFEPFEMQGEVQRLNRYGNSSSCIEQRLLKKICFCKQQ